MTSTSSSIAKLLLDVKVFQYVDTKSLDIQPYVFDIQKLGDKIAVMKTFVRYLGEFLTNIKFKNDLEITKIAGVVSFDNMASFPLIIELGIEMNFPFIMVKSVEGISHMIQGSITIGDDIVLIIDQIGENLNNIMQYIKTIEKHGGLVSCIIVLVDNDDGNLEELKKAVPADCKVFSIFNMSAFVESLVAQQLLTIYNYEKIANYINFKKTAYIKSLETDVIPENTSEITSEYPPLLQNVLRSAILTLMMEKKTALCLSLDVNSWSTAKKIIEICGDYICMIKTRITQYKDIVDIANFQREICELAAKYRFFILEDSGFHGKPSDIWNIAVNGMYGIALWSSFVTISGNVSNTVNYWNVERDKTRLITCPIIQASYESSKTHVDYMKEIEHCDVIAPLVITQNSPELKHILKLTPNILLKKHVPTGASHRSIEDAIVRDGNHIVIMGSAIFKGVEGEISGAMLDDLVVNVTEAANDSWRCFGLAYANIIPKIKQYKMDFTDTRKKLEKAYNKVVKNNAKTNNNSSTNSSTNSSKGILNKLMSSFKKSKTASKTANTSVLV
jgi:orotate phosphoribosyltransferase